MPSAREAFGLVKLDDVVFIHGGFNLMETQLQLKHDFHCFDLRTMNWTELQNSGPVKCSHTLTAASSKEILCVGGAQDHAHVWLYDTEEGRWSLQKSLPTSSDDETEGIIWHEAVQVPQRNGNPAVFCLGGFKDKMGRFHSDFIFKLSVKNWNENVYAK